MKRNPLAAVAVGKSPGYVGLFKHADLGANQSGLGVFKSIAPLIKASNFGADTRRIASPWQWQNR